MNVIVLLLGLAVAMPDDEPLPEVVVTGDDLRIERSCRLVLPEGRPVFIDELGDGLIHVVADGVRVELPAEAVLRGADPDVPPDELTGVGLRVDGRRDVTIVGGRLAGFHVGVWATACDGLVLDGIEVTDGFRQRLASTAAAADDGSDWLTPHDNDAHEWRRRYGAAFAVEDAANVSVRACRARRVQNGLILDAVRDSTVCDNDLSFLSGWGVALWRARGNVISRNALDFCIRGYSHGVYNRGQDSAGLLMFEQCRGNLVAENSITHGGDGVFAFAGNEALGSADGDPDGLDRTRRGNDDNRFEGNDLSYAAAHGLELTFSFGNVVRGNRLEGNAICGLWGGYSRDTLVVGNALQGNGEAGYGLERGGVNIEHGQRNVVIDNEFRDNACGVHLWWDPDEHLASTPWAVANGTASADNVVRGNRFEGDALAIQLRETARTELADNVFVDVATEVDATEGALGETTAARQGAPSATAGLAPVGTTRPVGARVAQRGREQIRMTEWGPWELAAPALGVTERSPARHAWRLLGDGAEVLVDAPGLAVERRGADLILALERGARGVFPYRLQVPGGQPPATTEGVLLGASWSIVVFPWSVDPREDEAAWRAQADAEGAVRARRPALDLGYGWGGMGLLAQGERSVAEDAVDRFGTVAETRLPLTAGRWRLVTLSDDGVRVRADGRTLIENWTWHGPTRDEAVLTLDEPRDVHLEVEHFELDGYAVLSLLIVPLE